MSDQTNELAEVARRALHAVADWPRYQCHKVVRAAQITGIGQISADEVDYVIELKDLPAVALDAEWCRIRAPQVGGYLVCYEDGYLSYSPAVPFERGYTPVAASELIGLAYWERDPFSQLPQVIQEDHRVDESGCPAGGCSIATGMQIDWQNGPLVRDGERIAPNGAFLMTVIAAAAGRLRHYQNTQFACKENQEALGHLEMAMRWLKQRQAKRTEAGVFGTHGHAPGEAGAPQAASPTPQGAAQDPQPTTQDPGQPTPD